MSKTGSKPRGKSVAGRASPGGEAGSTARSSPAPDPAKAAAANMSIRRRRRRADPLLVEVAWEAVNQVGGIYTVIRSKLPAMLDRWGGRYCVVGPYVHETASTEFEPITPTGAFGEAVRTLRDEGIEIHYGHWLVTGRPRAVLLDLGSGYAHLEEMRARLSYHHHVPLPSDDAMVNDVVAFGYLVERFLTALADREADRRSIIAHLHEWMGAAALPELRRNGAPLTTVFTTHATLLGRYVAAGDPWYYDHVPFVDWGADAERFHIVPQVCLERAAAHHAHVFTTVSHITAFECKHLLGREVDLVTPNGLNIERFTALHEFQNLHRTYKEHIHAFVMGHFFPSYTFDLDKTLYLFTSGRYEPGNKGFDLTIEALARLNWRMKQAGSDRTIVFFLITRRPNRGIHADVLGSRAGMTELRRTCDRIKDMLGDNLFYQTAMGKTPRFDDLVDEYWRLRLRRTQQLWRVPRLPMIVTHDLYDNAGDELLNHIRRCNLLNHADDPVKIIYHPDFINASNPLWGMDYDQFVRGCHCGVFPSYYEPWGYTPLECLARGIPAVTSDVSGFGSYVLENVEGRGEPGCHVLARRYASFDQSADELAEHLFELTTLERRDRIAMRNQVDRSAEEFDWKHLVRHYERAHRLAERRLRGSDL